MKHIMVDLETLGKGDDAVIVSLAAVQFDLATGMMGAHCFVKIDIDDCLKHGRTVEGSTLRWWLMQDLAARKGIATGKTVDLSTAMSAFIVWVKALGEEDLMFWGNSNTFDLVKLKNSIRAVNLVEPWKYYNERDVRTLVSFAPEIKDNMVFIGVKHDPIDDCEHQIKYCTETYKTLKSTKAC